MFFLHVGQSVDGTPVGGLFCWNMYLTVMSLCSQSQLEAIEDRRLRPCARGAAAD